MSDIPQFTIGAIDLSMKDPGTGKLLSANVYKVTSVSGDREMSIAALVMMLCLHRAAKREEEVIRLMKEMDEVNSNLSKLVAIHDKLVNGTSLSNGEKNFLKDMGVTSYTDQAVADKIDSLNSFSQETMIELQSQVNKRDQAYDMASNIIKSLNTTLVAIANNL